MQTLTPTPADARVTLLDALRGFALAGVLLMNMVAFSGLGFMSPEQMAALPTTRMDLPIGFVSLWLAYGKFYSLFSLLFGIGFALQLDAALRRGDTRLSVFKRRLLALLAIGLVHLYVWEGDILVLYALVGFLLMPFRHVAVARLPAIAAGLIVAPVLLQAAITASGGAANPGAPLWQAGERVLVATGFDADALPYPTLRDAGWGEYLRFQLSGVFFRYADLLTTGRPFKVLAMFLLGLWVGRSGLLRDIAGHVRLLARVRRWGFVIGLPAALLHVVLFVMGGDVTSWREATEAAAYAVGIVPLALAYAATFALLYQSAAWRPRLDRLAPAGRMALTNYLSQTVIQIGLFYGIGLGLMGTVGMSLVPVLAVLILTVQILVSRWWLARYQFGPIEWLWRQLTYGRRLPLARPSIAAVLLAVAVALPVVLTAQPASRARALHDDALVFDAHVHVVNRHFYHGGDMGTRQPDGQFDLVRAREGGLDALFFTLFVTEQYYPARLETTQALRLIDEAMRQLAANRDAIALAYTAADVERITADGRMAALLDLEGGFNLEGDLGVLRTLHRLGLRAFQLPAHNWANDFADSCCAPPRWGGLNEQGRAVVREANRLGMIVNVSHASDEAISQVLDVSTDPVLATHHGLRHFNDIPRTMPDALLRKLAAGGGVIGFHIGNEFHNRRLFDWRTARAGKPFWDTSDIGHEATLSLAAIDRMVTPMFPMVGVDAPEALRFTPGDWLAVVEHAIAVAGEDHVMLGSDFDGGPTLPRGMRDVSDLPRLTEAMLARGWSETRIRKFLGGNLLRVVRQVLDEDDR